MKTFKQFLSENSDLAQVYKLTKEQFDALPEPGPDNMENSFKVQHVAFDQHNGLGATPNHKNIDYIGFTAEMKPSTFLSLALDADRRDDAQKFKGLIAEFAPLSSPQLYISCKENPFVVTVKGHEGRGRMWAIDSINGNTPTPVHMILQNGDRARDLTPEFFQNLRLNGIVPEQKTEPVKVRLGRIFWMGKTV
jgi:hypothetical protein